MRRLYILMDGDPNLYLLTVPENNDAGDRLHGVRVVVVLPLDLIGGAAAAGDFDSIDATSSIVNSITDATGVLIRAAAEMKRTLDDLYTAEMNASPGKTPMEALADG